MTSRATPKDETIGLAVLNSGTAAGECVCVCVVLCVYIKAQNGKRESSVFEFGMQWLARTYTYTDFEKS